jgi:hypothetical protein
VSTPPPSDLPTSTITFTASVTRRGEWWVVSIPELDIVTLARRSADSGAVAGEAIAAHLELQLTTVRVQVVGDVELGSEPAD